MDMLNEYIDSQFIFSCAVALAAVAVGLYIIRRSPRAEVDDKLATSDMMSTFRDLYAKGQLSDDEYRIIKTKLAARLKELSKADEEPDFTEF